MQRTLPAINVICTFYNAESTLEATLTSLSHQTTSRAGFILIDDGSTDGGASIAEAFARKDDRFDLLSNPVQGRGRALNFGVARAESEYIAILDADDIAHPRWLEDGIAAMQCSLEFAVIGFERSFIRDDELPSWQLVSEPSPPVVCDVTKGVARGKVIGHSGAIIRRAKLVELGLYDADRKNLFDYDLWIRFAQVGCKLGICGLLRVAKRYHEGQKFAPSKGYAIASWSTQFRGILRVDPTFQNCVRLAARVIKDIGRASRRSLSAKLG